MESSSNQPPETASPAKGSASDSSAPAGGGLTSLDIWTSYDDITPVIATSITFPDGTIELTLSRKQPPPREQESLGFSRSLQPKNDENLQRSLRRTRSEIRKCLKTAECRYLLTLTTRSNITDYNLSRGQLTKFTRLLRYHYKGIKIIGVPETQKRGAWHWHLAHDQRLSAKIARALWNKCCGDGNIDCAHVKNPNDLMYLAKYLGKTLEKIPPGSPRYIRTRNIKHNTKRENYVNLQAAMAQFKAAFPDWAGEHFTTDNGSIWITATKSKTGDVPHELP